MVLLVLLAFVNADGTDVAASAAVATAVANYAATDGAEGTAVITDPYGAVVANVFAGTAASAITETGTANSSSGLI